MPDYDPIPNADILLLTSTVFRIPEAVVLEPTMGHKVVCCRQAVIHLCQIFGDERCCKKISQQLGKAANHASSAIDGLENKMGKNIDLANRIACLHGLLAQGPVYIDNILAPYRDEPDRKPAKAAALAC